MQDAGALFDAAFAARAGGLRCRSRRAGDDGFLIDCAVACSPLAALLPPAMLVQQAQMHRAAHDGAWPDAMHAIVTRDGVAIGHARIAWGEEETHLIDIAVLPEHRGIGAGRHLLDAWLAVADARGLAAVLQVQADNPARALYDRRGFTVRDPDPHAAFLTMARPAVQAR